MNEKLVTAAGLGTVTGLRSMTGLAMVSRELSDRRRLPRGASRLEEWLAEDLVAVTLSALALGEIVADKLPGVPDRIAPGALFGRGLIGGLVGAIAAGADHRAAGAAIGTAAAVCAAYLGWFLRQEAGRATMLPDAAVALVEDAVALASARELAREL
ncbi:MAG: DUF4126 domain-containing protein [Gemmatimonadota bacterium]